MTPLEVAAEIEILQVRQIALSVLQDDIISIAEAAKAEALSINEGFTKAVADLTAMEEPPAPAP